MRFGIARFPGSNCDQDAFHAVQDNLGEPAQYLWHGEADTKGCDVIVLPGGFSYGDYLRCGAIARFSPLMSAIQEHAAAGGLVIGVCNGFQILCEAHLLPGALIRNEETRFVCRHVTIRAQNTRTRFTSALQQGQLLSIPVAHGEGKYVCDEATLSALNRNDQVIFRYATPADNINGSADDIAGIANEQFNVFGMMPHPERACDRALGSDDGLALFKSLLKYA